MSPSKRHREACTCDFCGNNLPFDLPPELYESLIRCEVVIFAGAGVSTESESVFPYTLYDDVREELSLRRGYDLPFPDLMSKYCAQPNGRAKLLRKIRDRLDYVRSFPELYRHATRFHRELSTLFPVENIVTTNWDCYFEQECGAAPFVSAEDFAFWSVPGRKVFKIHGSVNSYGSIVATREDYELCRERLAKGLLGSTLKMLLATKTIVYVGFSFKDDDFVAIHDILTSEMHGLRPQSYIVTLDRASNDRFRERGLMPIYTDGTFFLSTLKQRLISDKQMIADERFDEIPEFLNELLEAHHKLAEVAARTYPDVIFALSYQDGMIHALERILALKNTGYYSHACNPLASARTYQRRIRSDKLKRRRYHDVAYIDGYIAGLIYFVATDDERRQVPIYYAFGRDEGIADLRSYKRILRKANRVSPKEHQFARMLVEKRNPSDDMVLQHTPFLL